MKKQCRDQFYWDTVYLLTYSVRILQLRWRQTLSTSIISV